MKVTRLGRTGIVGGVLAAALAAGGVGIASAAGTSGSAPTDLTTAKQKADKRFDAALRNRVHNGRKDRPLRVQRGNIQCLREGAVLDRREERRNAGEETVGGGDAVVGDGDVSH